MEKRTCKINDLVWAKMRGHPFWPAIIQKPVEEQQRPSKNNNMQWVFFLGTNNFGWIPNKKTTLLSYNKANKFKYRIKSNLEACFEMDRILNKLKKNPNFLQTFSPPAVNFSTSTPRAVNDDDDDNNKDEKSATKNKKLPRGVAENSSLGFQEAETDVVIDDRAEAANETENLFYDDVENFNYFINYDKPMMMDIGNFHESGKNSCLSTDDGDADRQNLYDAEAEDDFNYFNNYDYEEMMNTEDFHEVVENSFLTVGDGESDNVEDLDKVTDAENRCDDVENFNYFINYDNAEDVAEIAENSFLSNGDAETDIVEDLNEAADTDNVSEATEIFNCSINYDNTEDFDETGEISVLSTDEAETDDAEGLVEAADVKNRCEAAENLNFLVNGNKTMISEIAETENIERLDATADSENLSEAAQNLNFLVNDAKTMDTENIHKFAEISILLTDIAVSADPYKAADRDEAAESLHLTNNNNNGGKILNTKNLVVTVKIIGFLANSTEFRLSQGIVKNLIKSGYYVNFYTRCKKNRKKFNVQHQHQLNICTSLKEAVQNSDIILSRIDNSKKKSVKQILAPFKLSAKKMMNNLKGKIYVEMSNRINEKKSLSLKKALELNGASYFEAMLYDKNKAETGDMLLLAAGSMLEFLKCQLCFKSICRMSWLLGDVGKASFVNSMPENERLIFLAHLMGKF